MKQMTEWRQQVGDGASARVAAVAPLVLDIDDTCVVLSLGRTAVFDLLARGELTRVKIGRRTLVTLQSVQALVARSSQITR